MHYYRDNTAVMHRAAGGSFEGNHVRDLRRTTVHDSSSTAWGLNEKVDSRPGFNSNGNGSAHQNSSQAILMTHRQRKNIALSFNSRMLHILQIL